MKEYKTDLPKFILVKEKSEFKRVKLKCSSDSAQYAHNFYGTDIGMFESFFIILLNNANNTIGYVKISQGGITGTLVDIRIIAKYAIESLATTIIMVHNHPSGGLVPSQADKDLTRKTREGLKLLDVAVLDHIIIAPDTDLYFSFADDNLM